MANSPRKYNKSAAYWQKFHKGQSAVTPAKQIGEAQQVAQGGLPTIEFEGIDQPYMAEASCLAHCHRFS